MGIMIRIWIGVHFMIQRVFCGQYDCYKILGFDYLKLMDVKISDDVLKRVTKRYRKLSRKWHPDKNKSKGAKERFVKISQAYKILSNKKPNLQQARLWLEKAAMRGDNRA